MKTISKTGLVGALLLASGLAHADLSANIGWASEYHYRGIFQKTSSASAGIDYEAGGFYVGTWAADVDNGCSEIDGEDGVETICADGMEVDLYFGYGASVGDVDLSVGYTGYFYTGDFDDTYQEINLGAGFGVVSLDVAIGQYDNFDGPTLDYTYYALTFAADNGLYATLAGFSQDFEGEYLEVGYGTTVTEAEIDLGISLIFANDDLIGEADESLIFTIGKSFDLN
jgi:uncharacterized protein (TIGR02001 family)